MEATELKEAAKTGLSYDMRMTEHKCLWDENYPEKPERFSFPLQRCEEYALVARCEYVPCRPATEEEVLTVHSPEILHKIRNTKDSTDEVALEELSSHYDAVYFHPSTCELALLAAGSTIDLVSKVATGKLKNGMGLIRPPGHHAMYNEPCGYCFFNNVALAAKHAIDNLGVERVLIVDWDVHHGQATQETFYRDPRVLYFSIHRYEHGKFWPNLRESNFDFIGEDAGRGYNFNVPLNTTGLGNADYMAIFHQLLLPVAYEFSPDLVIVSSGYDAAIGCFEGCMKVTPACYAHLLSSLMMLAGGKVCVILEGGYCLKSLSEGVALTLRALLGDPCPIISPLSEPSQSVVESIFNVIYMQRPLWKSLQFQGLYTFVKDEDEFLLETPRRQRHKVEVKYDWTEEKSTRFPTRDCYPVQSPQEIEHLTRAIDYLIANTNLTVPPQRTAIAYDERMQLHRNASEPGHPEKRERIECIFKKLEDCGLIKRCHMVKARPATEDELILLHTKNHVDEMKKTESAKPRDLKKLQNKFQSVYFCQDSYQSALLALGCLLELLDSVQQGTVRNGAAVIRPPGHHAERNEPCGFCIFNNVAVAAMVAITKYNLERVLIVDWDVHHGNGIQHMFEHNPKVLYISIHRYDKGSFFPSSEDANFDRVGKGLKGAGYNVNVPWNKGGVGDAEYMAAFTQVVLPIAYEFDPQLVLVSAGFDAAHGDPLGGCKVTPEGFSHMTHMLSNLANGKLILALEGGYSLSAISQCMASCVEALLGDPCVPLAPGLTPTKSAVASIWNVIKVHSRFWKCLKFQADLPVDEKCAVSRSFSSTPTSTSRSSTSTYQVVSSHTSGSDDSLAIAATLSELSFMQTDEEADFDGAASSSTSVIVDVVDQPQQYYAVQPLSWCQHLDSVAPLPADGIDVNAACKQCGDTRENWLCLICHEVYCGRYVHRDMMLHHSHTGHCVVLSFRDLSVWCYGCEAYLANQILLPVLDAAHKQKFGIPHPEQRNDSA